MKNKCSQIKDRFFQAGFFITDAQANQFLSYYELLIETNKVMNLTAITQFEEVLDKHFLDSVMILKYQNMEKKKLIDVGTGAGFPGIPLKIMCPSCSVTLLDSLRKRLSFLEQVVEALGISEIEIVHARAEDGGRNPRFREQYDLAVSRAVANLSTLSEYCLPFVRQGGYFISYKSGKVEEEIEKGKRAFGFLGASLEKKEKFLIPGTDLERTFLFLKKEKKMSPKYPRKAGLPGKEPL